MLKLIVYINIVAILLLSSCDNQKRTNIDQHPVVQLLLDDMVNEGVSYFALTPNQGVKHWDVLLMPELISVQEIRNIFYSSQSFTDQNYHYPNLEEIDIANVELNTEMLNVENLSILEYDMDSYDHENFDSSREFYSKLVKNKALGMFIISKPSVRINDRCIDCLFYQVLFLRPKNITSVLYQINANSKSIKIEERKIFRR